jgi:hypothetical protein
VRPVAPRHLAALVAMLPGAVLAGEAAARLSAGLLTPESGLHAAVAAARSVTSRLAAVEIAREPPGGEEPSYALVCKRALLLAVRAFAARGVARWLSRSCAYVR